MPLVLALYVVYEYSAVLSIGHFPSPCKSARVEMIPKRNVLQPSMIIVPSRYLRFQIRFLRNS